MSIDKNLKIKLKDYQIINIGEGIYKINEFNLSTMFIIKGRNKALLIDCGTGVGDYKKVVKSLIGDMPYDLAITHAHVDHIGGRGQFEKMYLSKKDECIIKDVTVFYRRFFNLTMKCMGFKTISPKDMVVIPVKKEPELVFIEEGYVFDLGDRHIRVIETPGHTKGSISFLLEEERLLFSGDILNPLFLIFLKNTTTIKEVRATYQKLLDNHDYDTIWPCHLTSNLAREDIKRGIAVFDKLLKRCTTYIPFLAITTKNDFSVIYRTNLLPKTKDKR